MTAFVIRSILSIALLIGVYHETGKWTTIALTLGFIRSELSDWLSDRQIQIDYAMIEKFSKRLPS